jgi:hypothetical protein
MGENILGRLHDSSNFLLDEFQLLLKGSNDAVLVGLFQLELAGFIEVVMCFCVILGVTMFHSMGSPQVVFSRVFMILLRFGGAVLLLRGFGVALGMSALCFFEKGAKVWQLFRGFLNANWLIKI